VEIKPTDYSLDALAREPQTRRYPEQYGLVLITNYREFRLLKLVSGSVQTLERYTLAKTSTELWTAPMASFAPHAQLLPDFLARVMLYRAPLGQPKDVAWLLASYAREARARAEDHPLASFEALKVALQESLGIKFEGEKGGHFFRSTLVQTLFYGIFSAWVLWRRSPEGRDAGARFDWRVSAHYLRVPVLRKLFGEVADPGALNSIQLQEVLNLAGEALNRVQPSFFDTFNDDEAVAYFYEPFLEAFDAQLRKDLGVWYTPKEIVQYMVERVDRLLRTELGQADGLASEAVRILDPCCGTGAYLTAVLNRIHRTLKENAGDDAALVPAALRRAALERVFGFEIMPAPFVIAHLQIASLLEAAGAPILDRHRAGVFLTNALTGWVPEKHPKSVLFEEFRKEREDSEHIKQEGTILVILGNPPYNGYAGIAQIEEERDLTTAYRTPVPGLPAPQGQGLNDLYIRFFRIAERRIVGDRLVHGNADGAGIVCLISNNAWLDGLSHTSMRHRYLQTFSSIYIDNLNGDKYRTGKTTPDGKPDPSAFSTPQNREGIQVGTAIATLVRTGLSGSAAEIALRDVWGAGKLAQLAGESRGELAAEYAALTPSAALGNPFARRVHSEAYATWPRLPELFPVSFPGVKTSRDALVIDIDWERLEERVRRYLGVAESDAEIAASISGAMDDSARFDAVKTRRVLQDKGFRGWQVLRYAYRPFDLRWVYWEPETKLLDEKREGFVAQLVGCVHWIEARQRESGEFFSRGAVVDGLADNFGNGLSSFFPLRLIESAGTLLSAVEIRTNLSDEALAYLGAIGAPEEDLFFHALAIMHTPQYQLENAGALLADWPRIPLPGGLPSGAEAPGGLVGVFGTAEAMPFHKAGVGVGAVGSASEVEPAVLLARSAELGRRLAELLDAESSVRLGAEWSFLAALKLPVGVELEEALKITAGWGSRGQGSTVMPGRGRFTARDWTEAERGKLSALASSGSLTIEDALGLLGERCVDVELNGAALWAAVPERAWEYTLGGYQVLKKWLSYREAALLGRPLQEEEARYFSQVVRRRSWMRVIGRFCRGRLGWGRPREALNKSPTFPQRLKPR